MALLIDADIVAYEAASSNQREIEFEPDVWQIYCDLNEARAAFHSKVADLVERSGQSSFGLCFSDPEGANFRKQLNPDYKANRTSRKPVGYKPFIASLIKHYGKKALSYPRLEADDVLGFLSTRKPGQHVIWSRDKDLKQIPGKHFIGDQIVEINQHDADFQFFSQVLTGDSTDNYPGCPGIGPKKAEAILMGIAPPWGHYSEVWPAIVAAYEAADLTEDDALFQARMAFILRHDNYNPDTRKVKLWKPNPTS